MIRYTDTVTINEILGTLKTLMELTLESCVVEFGWQWRERFDHLESAVGGHVPKIIIPSVSSVEKDTEFDFIRFPYSAAIETVKDKDGKIVAVLVNSTKPGVDDRYDSDIFLKPVEDKGEILKKPGSSYYDPCFPKKPDELGVFEVVLHTGCGQSSSLCW